MTFNEHKFVPEFKGLSISHEQGSYKVDVFNNFKYLPTQSRYQMNQLVFLDRENRIMSYPIAIGTDFETLQRIVGLLPR